MPEAQLPSMNFQGREPEPQQFETFAEFYKASKAFRAKEMEEPAPAPEPEEPEDSEKDLTTEDDTDKVVSEDEDKIESEEDKLVQSVLENI